jgi:D-sedoheptulose 7-phosphate isomerase
MKRYFEEYFKEGEEVFRNLKDISLDLATVTTLMIERISDGGKVLWFGNGGSASDAQHLAAELIGRFEKNRKPVASIALNTDTSAITAIANDFGFETIFERQIYGLCKKEDIAIGITTSGKSQNVILGLKAAKEMGALAIALTGKNVQLLEEFCDHVISVPSSQTCHIQEAHIAIGQAMCGIIEKELF